MDYTNAHPESPHISEMEAWLDAIPTQERVAFEVGYALGRCELCEVYGEPNEDGFHVTAGGRTAVLCEALR